MSSATRPLLPLAAVTAGLASAPSLAAEWTFSPSTDVAVQSQQNPGLSPDPDRKHDISNGVLATLGLGMQRRTELTTLSLTPIFRGYRYDDNNNYDRDEEQVGLSYDWTGEKVSWHTGASGARDTTLTSELGTTGLTQGNLRHESWGASIGPTWTVSERVRVESTVDTNSSRYPDEQTSLSDYRYSTAMLSTTYAVSEQMSLAVYGTAGKLDSDISGNDTNDKSANIRVQYRLSPMYGFGASLGRSWVSADSGRTQGLLYSANVSRAFERSSLSFSISRRNAPSGRALLTEADEARLNFVTQLTERLSATAAVSYSRRKNILRSLDIDLERVRYTRADLGLAWIMTPNWRLGLTAGAANQQTGSAFFEGDLTGRGYEARLGFSWNGDPYVR
jgi:hypothetical protein